MSVITTRTSVLSILKIKGENKPSPHRVRFQLPSNVRKIFIDKKNQVNTKAYENLVCTIRDSEISDVDLKKLLLEAKNCVELLDYDLRLFVQALVILGWTHRSPSVVQVYQDFIHNVVSAHPPHAKDVIDQLVKLFASYEGEEWKDGYPNEIDEAHFSNIHAILRSIIKTIPLSSDLLLGSIKTHFPYHTISPQRQLSYMYNTLKIIEYLPTYRRDILVLLVDRIVTLDVHAPREDILDDQFIMEDVACNSVVDALDMGMQLLFRYFDTTCGVARGELRWPVTKALFADLLVVLERSILSSYGSHHVQFLLFYFVSLKAPLAQSFLNHLWQKVLSPSAPPIVRKMAVGYIASFLARSNILPSGFLKTYLSEMSTWVHRYIHNQDSVARPNKETRAHSVFYAVCQAMFYVIAFRHRDLVDSKKKLAFLQSLNLSKVVSCSLNPLRVCVPAVVDKFAAVARDHQLAYCYTIIENNARCYLETPVPEAFFPFDPYTLRRSNQYITPIYREYVETEVSEADDDRRNDETNQEDDDEFIDDYPVTDKSRYNVSYSTSPGFKQMSI